MSRLSLGKWRFYLVVLLMAPGVASAETLYKKSHGSVGSAMEVQAMTKQLKRYRITVADFQNFTIDFSATVYYRQGEPKVDIVAEPQVFKAIELSARGGTLDLTAASFSTQQQVVINLYSQSLSGIKAQGSVDIYGHGVNTNSLDLDLEGAIELDINGSASNCDIWAEGAISLSMGKFPCKHLQLQAEGSIEAELSVKSSIAGSINGVSEVRVYGDPGIRKVSIEDVAEILYQ